MIEFSSDMTVKLVRSMASDDMVVQAAQVSSKGENNPQTVPERLITALLRGRHGSPFEHTAFTFFVEAPIFVFREWQRHRISSFNEMSGRYTDMNPKFYIPGDERKMINFGTKMKPQFSFDRDGAGNNLRGALEGVSEEAWEDYQYYLSMGIANEVARMLLPINIYSQMYWTVNARSLMNFLSLRIDHEDNMFDTYPMYEIQECAMQVEKLFAEKMPLTHKAFCSNGRIAP